jgi:uncharacterized YccA/Bax inhibitor family protein
MGNPAFSEKALDRISAARELTDTSKMTINGTINRSGILLLLAAFGASIGWNLQSPILLLAAIIGALGLSLVIIFSPPKASFLAQPYAFLEGIFLGTISAMYSVQYAGIVSNALVLTFGVLAVMLALYSARIIRVTDRMRTVIVSATIAIGVLYLINMVMGVFGHSMQMLHEGGIYGIGFSLLVVCVASFNLLLDFDMIERSENAGAPKFMEWYGAFALLVTIVWLYVEILRLLSKRK